MNVIFILADTLRRDHCGAYTQGKALNECWSKEAPEWAVPTPNMDRLAARGTVFDNCYCGSTPCMPARRDIYTGRFEFPWRGWGPLQEEDRDLPREISGPPNQSIKTSLDSGHNISYMVTDHFHLWEQGACNYHTGYTGFDFIRGNESDALYTAPLDGFPCPEQDEYSKTERHFRNVHYIRKSEEDYFTPKVFNKAAEWLERNHEYKDFYLHLDCFNPHEPLDPPERLLKMFDEKGYDLEGWRSGWPYDKWEKHINDEQFNSFRARYAAKVVELDIWLGHLMETMDKLDLWKDTLVILTTDHGTYNGDHGRTGKLQTHQHDAVAHIPFIMAHPEKAQGERRDQLVQLVDIYPTVLSALEKEIPENIHGVDLLPVLDDPNAKSRDFAVAGMFGQSVTITDGEWILHQSPVPENKPLYWYCYHLARFVNYPLEEYKDGRREVKDYSCFDTPTWLSNKNDDINELFNLADSEPEKLKEMQKELVKFFKKIDAPTEQLTRLGLDNIQ